MTDITQARARESVRRILEVIKDTPLCETDIATAAHVSHATVRTYLAILHDSYRIHIAGWGPKVGRGQRRRLYKAGFGEDVEFPVYVKARKTLKKDDEPATDNELACTVDWVPLRKCPHPVVIRRDPLVAALFGEYQGARA